MSLRNNQNQGKPTGGGNPSKAPKNIKRVEDIILTSDHPLYNGPHDLGTIFFSDEKADEIPQDPTTLPTAIPLNRNLITYPLINDLVPISKGPSPDYYVDLNGLPTAKVNYYGPSLNIFNNTTNNILPNNTDDPQLGVYFKENVNLSPLKPGEGDTIIEGKNGQRIRFTTTGPKGSNSISRNVTDDPNDGNPSIGQRAMIISLGSGMSENITADNASIYMFENHSIPLETASTNVDSTKSTYTPVKDPLDAISEPPLQVESTPSPTPATQEQVVDFSDTLPENQAVEEKVTTPPPKEEDDPFDDPVFNALDEAIDEGLLTEQPVENYDISGTVADPAIEDLNSNGSPITEIDDDANGTNIIINYPNASGYNATSIIDNMDPSLKDKSYRKNNLVAINKEAGAAWEAGNYTKAAYTNKYGAIILLPPPDPNLTMKATTERTIKYLIIHCTAGHNTRTPADTMRGFFNPNGRNWEYGGYHWMVMNNGVATRCYPDDVQTNGATAMNPKSIHLNWIGGFNKKWGYRPMTGNPIKSDDSFNGKKGVAPSLGVTEEEAYRRLYGFGSKKLEGWNGGDASTRNGNLISQPQVFTLYKLIKRYIEIYPNIKVIGHNQVAAKNCPLFDVPTFMKLKFDGNNTEIGKVRGNNYHPFRPSLIENAEFISDSIA